jgi:hypothetical protein
MHSRWVCMPALAYFIFRTLESTRSETTCQLGQRKEKLHVDWVNEVWDSMSTESVRIVPNLKLKYIHIANNDLLSSWHFIFALALQVSMYCDWLNILSNFPRTLCYCGLDSPVWGQGYCLALCLLYDLGNIGSVYPAMSMIVIGHLLLY